MANPNRNLLLGGLALGAGLMYLLDPGQGRRRRAVLRDKLGRARRVTVDRTSAGARDLRNRTRGLVSKTKSLMDRGPVDDAKLEARVRARLGRVGEEGLQIHVAARQGVVTLSGQVPPDEMDRIVKTARSVAGVSDVVDQLRPGAAASAHSFGAETGLGAAQA